MTKYFVTVDQASINFPINKMSGLNTALQVAKDLHLSKIFGSADKTKAMNYYSEAFGYYNNQIKFMWNDKKKTQGVLLYFSATGFKAWQSLGKLKGYELNFLNLIKYLSTKKKVRFTRLDVVIDVIDGDLTVNKLHEKIQKHKIVVLDSLKRKISSEHQKFFGENKVITGITCGSRSSNNYLRIYDKKIEQEQTHGFRYADAIQVQSWIRFEAVYKNPYSHQIGDALLDIYTESDYESFIASKILDKYIFKFPATDEAVYFSELLMMVASGKEFDSLECTSPRDNSLMQSLKYLVTNSGLYITLEKIQRLYPQQQAVEKVLEWLQEMFEKYPLSHKMNH